MERDMDGYPSGHEPATEWSFSEPLNAPLTPNLRSRRRMIPAVLATGMLATTGIGVAIGHLAWAPASSSTSTTVVGGNSAQSGSAPRSGNGSGNYGGFFPFNGNSGSSRSGSNTTNGPANAS